jgi:hypothetical protein
MTGIGNVFSGLSHFPKHVWEWLTDSQSPLAIELRDVFDELASWEQTHEQEQIDAVKDAAVKGFQTARTAGSKVGPAILAGVSAAFDSGVEAVKALSTQAMTVLVSGLAK